MTLDHLTIERAAFHAYALTGTDVEDDALLAAHLLALREWAAMRRLEKRAQSRTTSAKVARALLHHGGQATLHQIARHSNTTTLEAAKHLAPIALRIGETKGLDEKHDSRRGRSRIYHTRVLRPGVA